MELPKFTDYEVNLMLKHINGKINHYTATPKEYEALNNIVSKADEYYLANLKQSEHELFDDVDNPTIDTIIWIYKKITNQPFNLVDRDD